MIFAISPKMDIMKEEVEHQTRQRGKIEVELKMCHPLGKKEASWKME
jgi:hypothetical protein